MKKKNEIIWGADPELFGPKDWYRNTLLINEVSKRIKLGHILDYGCGTGICLRRLLDKGYTMTGIDISQPNITFLKTKLNAHPSATIQQGDSKTLQQFKNTFDGIVCGETLEHIEKDEELIHAFRVALKKGGYVFISVPAHQELWTEIDQYAGHFRRYSKETISKIFIKKGFIVDSMYYWGYPLGLIWDRYASMPTLRKKIKGNVIFTDSKSLIGILLKYPLIKKILSLLFYVDDLCFHDNNKGNGLILVAQKK